MNARTYLRNSAIGLIVLAFAGAAMAAAPTNSKTVAEVPNQQQKQVNYVNWLSNQVRRQLVTLPWTGVFDNLEYKVDGNQVTLLGQVVNPVTKSEAQDRVKGIEGVTGVVNNIQVLPLSSFDNQIRWAEYRAIFSDPSLSRYAMGVYPSIHIVVDNGHVTLAGYVSSKMDRELAGIRAKGVANVFSVTNDLQVS